MVAYAKKNPGNVRVGTVGPGSVGHFTVEIISSLTGADLTMIPFKGAGPAVTAALGGHIEGAAAAQGVVAEHLKAGTMRGIVASSKMPEFPNIPTLAQLGYKQNLLGVWSAFFAPAGVSPEVSKTFDQCAGESGERSGHRRALGESRHGGRLRRTGKVARGDPRGVPHGGTNRQESRVNQVAGRLHRRRRGDKVFQNLGGLCDLGGGNSTGRAHAMRPQTPDYARLRFSRTIDISVSAPCHSLPFQEREHAAESLAVF